MLPAGIPSLDHIHSTGFKLTQGHHHSKQGRKQASRHKRLSKHNRGRWVDWLIDCTVDKGERVSLAACNPVESRLAGYPRMQCVRGFCTPKDCLHTDSRFNYIHCTGVHASILQDDDHVLASRLIRWGLGPSLLDLQQLLLTQLPILIFCLHTF